MSSENKKMLIFRANFLKLNELGRVSNNLIDVNFYLQKSLEILDTNSADKIQFQNYKGGKSAYSLFTSDIYFSQQLFICQ
jgi:hypothetical protein